MANPILNEKSFSKVMQRSAGEAGWAAPQAGQQSSSQVFHAPISDGPVSPYKSVDTMTASGTASAALLLMLLLMASAMFGWSSVSESVSGAVQFPAWTMAGALAGFVCAIVLTFKPKLARVLAPAYAIAQGVFVGAISKVFNTQYDGIVIQAVGVTLGVFVTMLVLYRTGVIRVTDKMRRTVIGATMGIAVFYGISLLLNLFGMNISFFNSSSPLSIGFSFLVAGLAAMNLALDFDFIERGEKAGLPKYMEWYAAFGLMVTIVWLDLEILRLLAKLRDR
ncbi:MAG: Bax inhibitor-1/YccA family protein [Actinobacteria bacterium]|nr:MAG: Bax inhibitor-1/YccA family protein [Actinomycetota bacterium]